MWIWLTQLLRNNCFSDWIASDQSYWIACWKHFERQPEMNPSGEDQKWKWKLKNTLPMSTINIVYRLHAAYVMTCLTCHVVHIWVRKQVRFNMCLTVICALCYLFLNRKKYRFSVNILIRIRFITECTLELDFDLKFCHIVQMFLEIELFRHFHFKCLCLIKKLCDNISTVDRLHHRQHCKVEDDQNRVSFLRLFAKNTKWSTWLKTSTVHFLFTTFHAEEKTYSARTEVSGMQTLWRLWKRFHWPSCCRFRSTAATPVQHRTTAWTTLQSGL